MARMHTKRHGKSKSRKPVIGADAPRVTELSNEDIEKQIVSLAKQGLAPSAIGARLKEEHKVMYLKQVLGKRLGKVLEEQGVSGSMPPDLMDLMKKAVNLRNHISRNKHDKGNTMGLQRVEAKIWRLTKYYRHSGKLPSGWKYDPEQAALLIKGK